MCIFDWFMDFSLNCMKACWLMSGMHVCVQNTDEEMLPEQMRVFPHCDHDYAARSDGKLFLCSLKET